MKLVMLVFVAASIVAEFAPGALGRSCQLANGIDYTGTISTAYHYEAGRVDCITWTVTNYNATLLGETKEVVPCRNPNNRSAGPWCYFGEKGSYGGASSTFEWYPLALCDLPRCTGPCQTGNGFGYLGTVNKTEGGKACRNWKDFSRFKDKDFPDASKEHAKNYCRNPDNDEKGPWCWYGDDDKHGYCDLPRCTGNCQKGNGVGYLGKVDKNKDDKQCKLWSTHVNNYSDEKFPDGSKKAARNYCRNPDNDPKGPWCFHGPDMERRSWEYCKIPDCP